jgi:hypothetical protein
VARNWRVGCAPPRVALGRRQRAQRRVYPRGSGHVVDEVANLRQRIVEITIVGYVDLLFLDHANDALGRAVWGRFTNRSHTDLDTGREQQRDILRRGVLNALISI